jgi:hypothetical protein
MKNGKIRQVLFGIIGLLICLSAGSLQAQDFRHAAGIRLGGTEALQYKHFFSSGEAVELLLGFGGAQGGLQAIAIYQWHYPVPLPKLPNLVAFFGVGGHTGYIRPYTERLYYQDDGSFGLQQGTTTWYTLGPDLMGGLEYRIYEVPITVGLDIRPHLDFYGFRYVHFRFWDVAVSVKYIF